jgi:DNA-binding transcriptional MerR regulator/effector-binding domain-containing protein
VKVRILIGEMARVHGISNQTLRYYDSIDLFKPLFLDRATGYRYYGIEQFAHLESILFLKSMGMSLKEIKVYFKNRDLNSMTILLKQKEAFIDDEIARLNNKKKKIVSILEMVDNYVHKDIFGKCRIQTFPDREMIFFNFGSGDVFFEHEYGIKKLGMEIQNIEELYTNPFCSVIDKAEIEKNNFTNFKGISLILEKGRMNTASTIPLPGGEYATIAYTGTYNDVTAYFQRLTKWIAEMNYTIIGDGLVLIITDKAYSDYEYEYISEIQVQVQKEVAENHRV